MCSTIIRSGVKHRQFVSVPMAHHKHIAHDLLSQAHPAPLAASIFVDKVLRKPLHLRPTSPDRTSQDARAKRRIERLRKKEKSQRRLKVKPLSAKEKRDSGIYEIPDTAKKYEIYVPLHRMWVGYMWEILGMKMDQRALVTGKSAGSKLASADYHGAEVTVVRSKCMGMVGLAGIVVRDTKFTFQIVTKKNALKSKSSLTVEWELRTDDPDCSSNTEKAYDLSVRDPTT